MSSCVCKSPLVFLMTLGVAIVAAAAFGLGHDDPQPAPSSAKPAKPGTIDLILEKEDIRKAVELLAINAGKKATFSDKVSGTITAKLYGVTLHEALDMILKVNGFGYVEKDGTIAVYTTDELRVMGKGPPAPPAPKLVSPDASSSKNMRTPISIDVKDEEIVNVLERLSISSQTNIVTSKNVQGKVTISVKDKPLGEVLTRVLTPLGYVPVENGNIVYVYTKDEYQAIQLASNAFVLGYAMNRIDGTTEDLSIYKGKVVLIVNVASQCGYTKQYPGLEKLYESKKADGLVILGFPANEFGKQEPASNAEIKEFCSAKFNVTFPMFEKIVVKGEGTAPLYKKLAAQPAPIGGEPKWNFTKFLVDKSGNVVARYEPAVKPDDKDLIKKIDELLASKSDADTKAMPKQQ